MRLSLPVTLLAVALALAGCASPEPGVFVDDPFEQTNRAVHEINKGADAVLLRPAALAYDAAVPLLVKNLVSNGLDMLDLPAIFVNQVLQGDPEAALATAGRFGVNVLMGGVLLDPATSMGLPKADTDFGVTLGKWGVGEGPYVELPLLGPSTARDSVGRIVEIAIDPFNFLTGVPGIQFIGYGSLPLGIVDVRYRNAALIDELLYESEDSYVAGQAAFLQNRRRLIAGGATEESLPDVFEE